MSIERIYWGISPTMFRRTISVALAALASAACPGKESRSSAREAPGVQDTVFAGTTAPLLRLRPPPRAGASPPAALLRSVTAAPGRGYDRVVFELAGDSAPGYRVEYAAGPVRSCGSGDVVSVAGRERLVVHLEPARAHDDQGNPVPPQRDLVPGLPAVREVKLVCDFEGQLEWVLGLPAKQPYRVTELAGRLLLDVKQGP